MYKLTLTGLLLFLPFVIEGINLVRYQWTPTGLNIPTNRRSFLSCANPSSRQRLPQHSIISRLRNRIQFLQRTVYGPPPSPFRARHPFNSINNYNFQPPSGVCGCRRPSTTTSAIRYCDLLIQNTPTLANGVYNVTANGQTIQVFCEFGASSGNWLVFQRRTNGAVNFYRNWINYDRGFGNPAGEFWLGLANLYELTRVGSYALRVDLQDFSGRSAFAEYNQFAISSPSFKYRLQVAGFSGNAGDSLSYHNNLPFTTRDFDNDNHYQNRNCAVDDRGAWWYNSCQYSNLNGNYFPSAVINTTGVTWYTWKNSYESLRSVTMKLRPNDLP